MLRIEGLTKRYRTGEVALKGVSLDVPDSQVIALIGPSGAGKSTLIRCVNRLVEPSAGTITLNDTEITVLGSAELRRTRRRLGMIFQEYALVERLTVMENVLSGRLGYVGFWQSWSRRFPQKDIEEAFGLLARVGLDDGIPGLLERPQPGSGLPGERRLHVVVERRQTDLTINDGCRIRLNDDLRA